MRIVQYLIYSYLFASVCIISLNMSHLYEGVEVEIEHIGSGSYNDFDWYQTSCYKDSAGKSHFFLHMGLLGLDRSESVTEYSMNDGMNIAGFYNHMDLGTKLTIQSKDYVKLNNLGELISIFYRLVYILIGILILLFIRQFKKGKIFESRTITYLQLVGGVTILLGFISIMKGALLEQYLKSLWGIKLQLLSSQALYLNIPFYVSVGLFIVIIAFCFGRGNYLEKQNDLTI